MLIIVMLVRLENKFDVAWEYEFTPEKDRNLEHLAYVLFDDGQGFHLAKVDAWSSTLELVPNGTLRLSKLRFSHVRGFGSHATDLLKFCDRPLNPNEVAKLGSLATSGESRPISDREELETPLALGMAQAKAAVCRYYHLKTEQVEITIHSAR